MILFITSLAAFAVLCVILGYLLETQIKGHSVHCDRCGCFMGFHETDRLSTCNDCVRRELGDA